MTGAPVRVGDVDVVEVASLRDGFLRLYDIAEVACSQPMLVVAALDFDRDDFGLTDPNVIALACAIGVEEPATLVSSRWRGGPVLAVGVDHDDLGPLLGDPRITTIIVAPNTPGIRSQRI